MLRVWQITRFEGTVRPLEGQEVRWVLCDALDQLDFLEGNRELLERVCMSDHNHA